MYIGNDDGKKRDGDDDDAGGESVSGFQLLHSVRTTTPQHSLQWHAADSLLFGCSTSDEKVLPTAM